MDLSIYRQDFPMLQNKMMQGHPLVYLDNGATTFKPQCVIDAIVDYMTNYTANAHRGDYDLSAIVDSKYEEARQTIASFVNAKRKEEIVFTSGTTESLNLVAKGYAMTHLQAGDEILISVAEHASNTLPWFDVARSNQCVVNYIDLDEDGCITMEAVKKAVNEHTKIISLAHVTNVLGHVLPVKEICDYAHERGIIVVIDGAQSVPHMPVDVQAMDCDFLAFSGHKMCGPTGIGVLYGKYPLLKETYPLRNGGGNNARYNSCGVVSLKNPPEKFEAGTPNISGAIGLGAAAKYLMSIGMENIHAHELELRKYAIEKMSQVENIEIYNPKGNGPIAFNVKGVFSQDTASLFNKYGVAVRAGQHCAKILDEYLHVTNTVRASFYFYNTKEEVDQLIEVCKKGDDFLDAFF